MKTHKDLYRPMQTYADPSQCCFIVERSSVLSHCGASRLLQLGEVRGSTPFPALSAGYALYDEIAVRLCHGAHRSVSLYPPLDSIPRQLVSPDRTRAGAPEPSTLSCPPTTQARVVSVDRPASDPCL